MGRAPITFTLRPVQPFRLDLTAWALRRRPQNEVDRWDGETYQRVLGCNGYPVSLSVRQRGEVLKVAADGPDSCGSLKAFAGAALERLLGIRTSLEQFYEFASRDPRLSKLAERFRGLKPPRFPSVFEALVNGITCQQLSLTVGIILLNRLSARYGLGSGPKSFPGPEELALVEPDELRPLGYSHNKARAVVELARAAADGNLDLEALSSLGDEEALARLLDFRGVGRWTAEYVLLRGLGRIHLFPGDDVGARSNLERWLHLRKPLDYAGVRRALRKWEPYGGLIYFHLLLDRLEEAGRLG